MGEVKTDRVYVILRPKEVRRVVFIQETGGRWKGEVWNGMDDETSELLMWGRRDTLGESMESLLRSLESISTNPPREPS
jgi:hypothetical protein